MLAASSTFDIVLYLLAATGSMLLVYGIYETFVDSRSRDMAKIKARLQERAEGGKKEEREKRIRESLLRRQNQQEENFFLQAVQRLEVTPRLQAILDQANVDYSAPRMLAIQAGVAMSSLGILFAVGGGLVLGLIAAAATMFLPLLWLVWKRGRRINKLVNQLPDVFEIMSQSLRAGHSLAGAIQLVAEQLPDPCGTEFSRVFHEQNLGIRLDDALLSMAKRCDQMDVRFFVTAVLIQRQTGGDLAEILDKISSVIRSRIELLGTVRGLTAEGRLSGWVLFALPVMVFIASYYMNREYAMMLINEPQGRMLLCGAGMMQLMGMAMIKKIVSIKV